MSEQRPIGSGFGERSTASEVIAGIDLSGKTFIVTGGYSGLGLEATRRFVDAGARVVVPARSLEKARANLAGLDVELEALDLFVPESVDAFAARFLASGRPLHALVNCAGIMGTPLERNAKGQESQLATNHLGHFQLTANLWPALVAAGGARVISVSSRGHRFQGIDFDDPFFEIKPYDKWRAYGQSKTANILFARSLDQYGTPAGVRAFSLHPGAIKTDLQRHMTEDDLKMMGVTKGPDGQLVAANPAIFKSVEQGAATIVWCTVSTQLDGLGGVYCEDCDVAVPVPADAPTGPGLRPWANDQRAADRLWDASQSWTGAWFPA